jgi:hypothetical protein
MNAGFILGVSLNETVNQLVEEENSKYGDIIQGDFLDTYRNHSYKSLVSWRWITHACMKAKYYLKIDDDVLPVTPTLLLYLADKELFNPPALSFSSAVVYSSEPNRNKSSKFFVSHEDFPDNFYPDYPEGNVYEDSF